MTTANEQQVEQVLVVPTALFREVGYFQGFTADVEPYMRTLLDPAWTSYQPRDVMEQNPDYKQLIPYCVFCCKGDVFYYKRGNAQGESRLHAKRSVGVGGHISSIDESAASGPYREGMRRELEEEVYVETPCQEKLVGLINDDETSVGRVHLGIVHVFELEEPKVRPREASMTETGFAPPSQLLESAGEFETWSEICLRNLFPGVSEGR